MDDGAAVVEPWYTTLFGVCFLSFTVAFFIAVLIGVITYRRRGHG